MHNDGNIKVALVNMMSIFWQRIYSQTFEIFNKSLEKNQAIVHNCPLYTRTQTLHVNQYNMLVDFYYNS